MFTRSKTKRGSRGSALLIVAYLGVILAGIVGVYFYNSSHTASQESVVRENSDAVQAAAAMASEIAIANLTDMEYTTANGTLSIAEDWVNQNPYGASMTATSAERRIRGAIGDYDYVVMVRSVRDVRDLEKTNPGLAGLPDKGWLSNVDPSYYNFGHDPVRLFTGAYEVIATARNRKAPSVENRLQDIDGNPALAKSASVRTVVNLSYNSFANYLEHLAPYNTGTPGSLLMETVTGGKVVNGARTSGAGDFARGSKLKISGEEHYAVKAAVKDVEDKIEGLASIHGLPSQLYSVTNNYWKVGRMTLQYKNSSDFNPIIPRTTKFSTAEIDRTMVALDPSAAVKDQYVFGGKVASTEYEMYTPNTNAYLRYSFGRSVTLNEAGLINETHEKHAKPEEFAKSSLAVGSYDNIMNLYLNYVMAAHPTNSASVAQVNSWKQSQWNQMPIGYHTKNAVKNPNIYNYRRPLDNTLSPARRRWATLIWIKNSEGQFLAREYAYTSSSTPPDKWLGRYAWAWYKGYQIGNGYNFHQGNFSTVVTDKTAKAIHPRYLTLEELLGYKLYKDARGIPAKVKNFDPENPPASQILPDNMIVAGIPDYYLVNGERVPFEPYEAGGTVFDEAWQRYTGDGDNYGVNATTLSQMPPKDGLYVRDHNGSGSGYTHYKHVSDFAFPTNIAEEGDEPDWRDVITLHMVIEDTPENNSAGTLYFDMGLTITVVLPKRATPDDEFLKDAFRQWWEGEAQESLTGDKAQAALYGVPNRHIILGEPDDVSKMQAYYKQFGFYNSSDEHLFLENITTMIDPATEKTGFPRVKFIDQGANRGKLDNDYLREKPYYPGIPGTYYYGQDDLYEFFSFYPEEFYSSVFAERFTEEEWEDLIADVEEYEKQLFDWREQRALQMMTSTEWSLNPGCTFIRIENRFNETERSNARLSLDRTEPLKLPEKDVLARELAAQGFGYKNTRLPAAYVRESGGSYTRLRYNDLDSTASNDLIPTTNVTRPLIPGEIVPAEKVGSLIPSLTEPYMPMMAKLGEYQPNGRPITPGFVWKSGDIGEVDITKIHDWPEWFMGIHDMAVDVAYRNGDLKTPLLEGTSVKAGFPNEHRGALGWHREGPVVEPPSEGTTGIPERDYELMFGDHYEYLIFSEKGFNPYRTVTSSDGEHIALVCPDGGDPAQLDDYVPVLKSSAEMPTFVINGDEIDGSGIMVVNGNLEVRNRFAYHGLLIVLGDLVVRPEKGIAVNIKGQVKDSNGNTLIKDPGTGNWYYNDGGTRKYSTPYQEWLGKLIVQGMVYVAGDTLIDDKAAPAYVGDEEKPAGTVDVRASTEALQDVVEPWLKVAPNEGFTSERLGWSSGANTEGHDLWKE